MSTIQGIVVNLTMGSDGTDDHIYVGVVGTGGGREFPLNVAGFDDFEKGSNVTYSLGTVWDGAAISDPELRHPIESHNGGHNDPGRTSIHLQGVNYVYIRKGGTPTKDDDDACTIKKVIVTLYGPRSESRSFNSNFSGSVSNPRLYFSNETGLQHWLKEEIIDTVNKVKGSY